jgi:hypothetical protein
MKKICLLLALVALNSSAASIVFQDNWSGDTGGLAKTTLVNWTVLAGRNVDIGDFGALCSTGAQQCLDTQGSGGNPNADISTISSFALSPGFTYTLAFTLDNAGASTGTISVGTAFSQAIGASGGSLSFNFTSTSQNAQIRIVDTGAADNVGLYIGNIVLSSNPITAGVPEPSTFGLAGLALLALGATKARLNRRS